MNFINEQLYGVTGLLLFENGPHPREFRTKHSSLLTKLAECLDMLQTCLRATVLLA
jgi:hypothetical protein